MAFLLRTITPRTNGPDIVRDRAMESQRLTIGRAAERDIHLPDLAVEPDHAAIERLDDRRILVRSTGTLGFTVDGRSADRVEIDSGKGAELGFGGHSITVGREGDNVTLTVRRAEAISDAAEEKDETAIFSLKEKLPGKRALSWGLALAILIAFLAVPIISFAMRPAVGDTKTDQVAGDGAWSPGPLSQAHHSLENNCTACHVKAFESVRNDTCQSCHKDAHDHAPADRLAMARAAPHLGEAVLRTVASTFGKEGPGACVDCHGEHDGAGRMPPTPQAFCADCHGSLKDRLADTALGDATDFGRHHPEFRALVATKPGAVDGKPTFARLSLSDHPSDRNNLIFPHDLHLSRSNGVARMAQRLGGDFGFGDALACGDCHKATADGVRFQPVTMEKNCQMCHSLAFDEVGGTVRTLPHGRPEQVVAEIRALYRGTPPAAPPMLDGNSRRRPGLYAQARVGSAYVTAKAARPTSAEMAVQAAFAPKGVCGECHVVSPPGANSNGGWRMAPVHQTSRFFANGWFDHDAHRQEKCESCHGAQRSAKADDLLLPDLKSCRTCHGGEGSRAKVATGCALCHNYHADDGAPWAVKRGIAESRSRVASARP